MAVRTYLVLVVLILCISIISNLMMYNKCYLNNDINDPFLPENIGMYSINIYYNKFRYPDKGVVEDIKPYIEPLKNSFHKKYVITYNKPTQKDYEQMTKIGNYQTCD
jgi:hypothetical protein